MDQGRKFVREENPRETASIFSVVSFLFTYKIFKKGVERELDNADVYEVRSKFESHRLGDRLEDYWIKEKKSSKNPSLLRVLIKCFGPYYLFLGFVQLFMRTGMALLQPKALGKFVAYFSTGQTAVSATDCYFYAFLVIGLNFVNTVYNHNFMQVIQELGITIRTSVCSLIYRKILRLSPSAQSDMGKIVTFVTKDVSTFDTAIIFFNDMWIGFIQTALISYIIYAKIGLSVFSGMGFFMAIIPLQVLIGRTSGITRLKSFVKTDKRFQLVQEALSAIKIIKMYTWEKYFSKKITDIRKEETNLLKKIYYLKFIILIIGGLASKVAFYLLIMTYIWTGHFIDAEIVYFVQNCFHTLRSYMTISIPLGITQTADFIAATSRMQDFLNSEEMKPNLKQRHQQHPKVFLDKVSTKVNDVEILKEVSINLEKGLLVLTGNVGSGKSSVLKTILGEYPISSGKIEAIGSISYVPQEPWLFPSTIRQNILFGEEYNENRYREVLNVCALTLDLSQFEDGDSTVVSDKGVNLSKGQQARICLARALYKDSDIYLLDDCLAALDSRVSQHVFKECILEFLKDKICILVTHNMNHIKKVSGSVLFIEKGETLSLNQQNESLDKRITYYIDDGEQYDLDVEDDEDGNEDGSDDEYKGLLKDENHEVSKNLYYEENKAGQVSWKVYRSYYNYAGGFLVVFTLLVLFVACQAVISYSEKIVSVWVNIEPNITNLIKQNLTDTTEFERTLEKRSRILKYYTLSIIVSTVLTIGRAVFNFHYCLKASKKIHNALTDAVLNTYMTFFDTHFVGNIVNRFSKDFSTIDESIPFLIYENLMTSLTVLGVLILIATVNPKFIIASAVLLFILYTVRKYYVQTGRAVKRLEASTRSPMLGYINATMEGLTVIRAYGNQSILISEFDRHQDLYTSAFYMMTCSSRAFCLFLDVLCSVFLASIILKFTLFRGDEHAGDVGLAVSQALMLTGMLQWAIRNWAELENNMTSVERVQEYTDIKTEDTKSGLILPDWPTQGKICYKDVRLTYRTSNEQVLKDISFEIPGKSKIGIVGRTGAGKSSIISTLFRLYEVDGTILIDDEDTKRVSLEFLRSSIAIIPQDPVLFSGTIRDNIDPLGKYSDDARMWEAIEKVNMKHAVSDLSQDVKDKGSNFSSGQRQLLCLARALISKNKIVVLDEATANMDPETDALLQKSIKENFSDCTVLTIAHRLHTIINSEKVMVVDGGKIVQYDSPSVLLEDKNGQFSKMVKHSGIVM